MPTVSVHQAKTHLPHLIVQAEAGEEVVITRNGVPVARLVLCQARGRRQFGALKGRLVVPDCFLDPLPETELQTGER